jgi:hypothetical protein
LNPSLFKTKLCPRACNYICFAFDKYFSIQQLWHEFDKNTTLVVTASDILESSSSGTWIWNDTLHCAVSKPNLWVKDPSLKKYVLLEKFSTAFCERFN